MKWQHALVLIVLCFTSFTAMCKNPVLKNTKWTAVQEMFVADAGTMTTTITLEFGSAKDVVIREKTVMPSHPAMYMNPDGTIDTIEGWTNERETKCTCSYKKGILTLTEEDGDSRVYFYQSDGTFTFPDSFVGEILVFRRIEEQES